MLLYDLTDPGFSKPLSGLWISDFIGNFFGILCFLHDHGNPPEPIFDLYEIDLGEMAWTHFYPKFI